MWAAIIVFLVTGSLSVMPVTGNTKTGDGKINAQQRLLLGDQVFFEGAFLGSSTCQVAPNQDSMQCEILAFAGDKGNIILTVINNANTPTVAVLTMTSDPNLEWGVSSSSGPSGIRSVGDNQFAFFISANSNVALTLMAYVNGVAPDGTYNFNFGITPEI